MSSLVSKSRQKNPLVQPFVKWVGGKRQLLPAIRAAMPAYSGRYFEPFLGGGAVFFDHAPRRAVVGDLNGELINCYEVIRDTPEELLQDAQKHENTSDYFHAIHKLADSDEWDSLSPIQRASGFLWLRNVASRWAGDLWTKDAILAFDFDGVEPPQAPFPTHRAADESILRAVSHFLRAKSIEVRVSHPLDLINTAKPKDFVFLDYSNSAHRWLFEESSNLLAILNAKGAKWLVLDSNTPKNRASYAALGACCALVPPRPDALASALRDLRASHLLAANYFLPTFSVEEKFLSFA